ncbi:MAG: ATP synthase F0 subunit B [Acidobacteriota bacterium]
MPLSVDLWSLLISSFVFLLTLVSLHQLLFKPLLGILDKRHAATVGTQQESVRTLEHYESRFAEYQGQLKEEKKRGYKRLEQIRGETLGQRQAAVERARQESARLLDEARHSLEGEVARARASIEAQAGEIAADISSAILERSR